MTNYTYGRRRGIFAKNFTSFQELLNDSLASLFYRPLSTASPSIAYPLKEPTSVPNPPCCANRPLKIVSKLRPFIIPLDDVEAQP